MEAPNPTYLALHPNGRALYAVHELTDYMGLPSSAVSAYQIGEDGALTLISRQPTFGGCACHLSLGPGAKHLLVSNFIGGSVCAFPIGDDLGIQSASCFFQHYGHGADPIYQATPHTHQALADKSGHRVLVADLGLDEIRVYGADWGNGHLIPGASSIRTAPGQGPRQFVLSKAGDRLYVLTELGSAMYVFSYDRETGVATELEVHPLLPEDFAGVNTAACVRLTPDERLLFASNRGHDSIVSFRVLPDGKLTKLGTFSSGGRVPRDFAITPDGRYLIAGNQETDELVVFEIDAARGALTEVSRAACPSVTAVLIT